MYAPFGYGTPFFPLGLLFLFWPDDLGVDPRCFVGWNMDAKMVYLLYNVGICFLGCIFAVIIIFNIARPQTKRRGLIKDLNSQAKGTVVICFSKLIFWILATLTYTFNQESDHNDPYCLFVILLGWFGVWIFIVIGVGSQKWRAGAMRRKKGESEEEDLGAVAHFDSIDDPEAEEDAATLTSEVSRPASAVSSRPATAASAAPEEEEEHPEEEEEEEQEEEEHEEEEQEEQEESDHEEEENEEEDE